MITSVKKSYANSFKLLDKYFKQGGLPNMSQVRYDRIFTLNKSLVVKLKGQLNIATTRKVLAKLRLLFSF